MSQPQPERPIREIMRNYSALMSPSNPKTGYDYCRVFNGNYAYEISEAKMFGWEVVSGDDPEDIDHKMPDGTRQIGDTTLMRISKTRRKEITDYKNELDDRLSGKREDERLDELIREKGQGKIKPFSFTTQEELKHITDKLGGK
jgi:hypothetical protein